MNLKYNQLKNMFWHIFFPNKCLLCDEIIHYDEIYCSTCDLMLQRVPIGYKKVYRYSECYAPYYYSGNTREAVIKFKFQNNSEKSKKFSILMVEYLLNNNLLDKFDYITYIPKYRKQNHVFNSSFELAKLISKITNKPMYNDILIKTRKTAKQHTLDYQSRQTNLVSAFICGNKKLVYGARILIIDDVCTTGSTLETCAEVLINNGANKVTGLVTTISIM